MRELGQPLGIVGIIGVLQTFGLQHGRLVEPWKFVLRRVDIRQVDRVAGATHLRIPDVLVERRRDAEHAIHRQLQDIFERAIERFGWAVRELAGGRRHQEILEGVPSRAVGSR